MSAAFIRADSLYAWKGSSLLITTARGDCDGSLPLAGYYFREARFVRTLRMEVNGESPWLCDAGMISPDALTLTYVHPEITQPGGGGTGQSGDEEGTDAQGLPERALDLQLTYSVSAARLDATLLVTNRARRSLTFDITCVIDTDFADIQEAQTNRREQQAAVVSRVRDGVLEFAYEHPQLPYRGDVLYGGGWEAAEPFAGRLEAKLTLAPQQARALTLQVIPRVNGAALSDAELQEREAALEQWRASFARFTAPGNRLFEQVFNRNVRDFASFPMLHGDRREWLAMQAGMPVYPAFFGRDAITAGWQAGMVDGGQSLDAALAKLTRLQSNRVDDWHDEQPGRIPYQMRSGPLALLDINPYSAYYADFASPLMFIVALANLYAWCGDRDCLRRYWDAARRILDWARTDGDPDRDGYLEYQTRSKKGTKNQGWKDSGDAIIYDDGSPVPSPIATCEVQGYWYIAQELMSLMCLAMGAPGDAMAYRTSAQALKTRFNRDWWLEEEQFVALALDPEKQRVRAITSNVGHCLATGIIDSGHRPAVVGRLFAPDMFSGWGVRTLSSAHAFYNPLSYHRGTVWAVEQGTIVFGLRRFGFDTRALELTQALFDLAQLYPEYRIPECVGGYARGERAVPGAYPRANTPQLWNATAFPIAVQSLLGLIPIAPLETLVVDPILPTWIPELVVRGLRVGEAKVSLRFWRDEEGRSKWDVLHKSGKLHLVRQPPPESITAGWAARMSGVVETLVS
jgi:glycogen debranching enzyme